MLDLRTRQAIDRQKKLRAQSEVDAFDQEREMRESQVEGINAIDRASMPRSGYTMGEKEYIGGLERAAGAAKARSILEPRSGAYGVNHSYAGTDFGSGGGGSPSMAALRRATQTSNVGGVNDQGDNVDGYMRRAAIENATLQNNRLRQVAFDESVAHDPLFVDRRRTLAREQHVKDAAAAGEGATAKYNAEEPIRFSQEYDERKRMREYGYKDPGVRAAEINAVGRVAEEQANRQREKSAALKALGDLAKQASGIDPEITEKVPGTGWFGWGEEKKTKPNPQWQMIQDTMDQIRRSIDMDGGPGAGAGGEQSMTLQELEAFAAENGITIEEAQQLARQHGYAVRQ